MATHCPGCGSLRPAGDLFCEACGADFTTAARPAMEPAPTRPAGGWVALIDAERALFESHRADNPQVLAFPVTPGPREVALPGDVVVLGRRHEAEGFFPDIDLSAPVCDPGVSRHHAVLHRRSELSWGLMDTDSTNGTWLNRDPAPLKPGEPVDLHEGDRIRIGLFTVITLRRNPEGTCS